MADVEKNSDKKIESLIEKAKTDPAVWLSEDYLRQKAGDVQFPVRLRIEPTNFCNIRCTICPTHELPKSMKGFMEFGLFEKMLDEIEAIAPGFSFFLTMYLGGEPLMHKDLCRMIEAAYKRGHYTHINTNCTLLDAETAEKLIRAGLDRILFSFDDMTPGEFERIRKGSDYDLVYRNIVKFLEIKESIGLGTPQTVVAALKIPRDEPGEERTRKPRLSHEFVSLFRKKPVQIMANWAHHWAGDYEAGEEGMVKDAPVEHYYPCNLLWEEMSVRWDGTVVPCCYDLKTERPLGKFPDHTLEEIWNSDEYVALRRAHVEGRAHEIPLCAGCSSLECTPQMEKFFGDADDMYRKKFTAG